MRGPLPVRSETGAHSERAARGPLVQRLVGSQDSLMELAEMAHRLDAEFVLQPRPQPAVHREGIAAPVTAVQSQHLVPDEPLTKWIFGRDFDELLDKLSMV